MRERKDDIPILVEYFLDSLAEEYGKPPRKILPAALKYLQSYDWPGNVRELKNVIERLVIMTPSNIIDAKNLFIPVEHDGADYFQYKTLKDARMPLRKTILQRSLKKITGIYQGQQRFWMWKEAISTARLRLMK